MPETLSPNHWTLTYYTQRMTTKAWRYILLNNLDTIYLNGESIKLKAKRIGFGLVEVSKDLQEKSS